MLATFPEAASATVGAIRRSCNTLDTKEVTAINMLAFSLSLTKANPERLAISAPVIQVDNTIDQTMKNIRPERSTRHLFLYMFVAAVVLLHVASTRHTFRYLLVKQCLVAT